MKLTPIIWSILISKLAHTIFISLALELKDEIQFEIREKGPIRFLSLFFLVNHNESTYN